jgi:lipopolysaccharide export system protein LptA
MMRRLLLFALLVPAAGLLAAEAPRTVLKGRKMEIIKRGETVSFSGGVTMTRGNDFMSADRMINHEKEGVTEAWGNVYLRRTDPVRRAQSEAWGDEGTYDSVQTSGTLRGNVIAEIRESTPTMRMTRAWAGFLSFDSKSGALRLERAPATRGPRARFQPPWPAGVSPRPLVVVEEAGGRRNLRGNVLTYFEKDSRVTAEGAVRADWENKDGRNIGGPHDAAR